VKGKRKNLVFALRGIYHEPYGAGLVPGKNKSLKFTLLDMSFPSNRFSPPSLILKYARPYRKS